MRPTQVHLEAGTELRLEVAEDDVLRVKLLSGLAEVFGSELAPKQEYVFSNAQLAIFSWHGANLELTSDHASQYQSTDTPMRYYLNTHMALEQRRMQNQQSGHPGPRVLVTGPSGSGRTSLCRILLNYAVRIERTPLFVDLNPREGNLAVPGTLGAAVIEEMLPPELPFVLANPHVLHFGHAGPEDDRYVYDHQVASLARIVSSKMESDPLVQASGMFINCPALAGADVLATRAAFGCDVVIVLDNERLVNELNALVRQSQSPVEIIGLPKSGGVVVRDESMSKGQDHAAFYKYFYGNPKSETYNLSPFSFDVKLGKVQVFRLGGLQLPASLLPVDADVNEYRLRVSEAPASAGWKHRICSVVEEADIGSSVLGCVCILHYDEERQVIKVLSPAAFPLPATKLLLSSLSFQEG